MQRRIITLLCAAGMAFSTQTLAANLEVRPNAPERYTVKQGDTLWGISGKYLYSPWQWGRLWDANRDQIHNPDLIYPDQVLVLRHVDGEPRLGLEQTDGIPVVKMSPDKEVSGYGIPAIDVNFYRIFMRHPQIVSRKETAAAPRLLSGPEGRLLYTKGTRVYTKGLKEPGRYLTYRINKNITDPDTGKFLGQEVAFSGIVRSLDYTDSALEQRSKQAGERLKDNEYHTRTHPLITPLRTPSIQPLVVETAISEIQQGDYLMKMPEDTDRFNMMPHEPSRPVQAKIVSVFEGTRIAGQFQTITIDKGEADGLDKGTVLSLYKRKKTMQVDLSNNFKSRDTVELISTPAEEVGLAMVYRTSEHLSSAIILENISDISVGDTAANPGRDLDNIPDQGRSRVKFGFNRSE
ncbi:TPA: LysM peptidoglycan-binding domain-containing protein [Neisseria meningitidis]|uniref:LysM peptidoglycan-binding domain-containing protein n=1 Tax=Neisseria meningitidis TaxID=487 RepID=UPI0007668E60|nr:LysM peptidoglycan-binding domain-containing protein [Neisseria meningitidis]MBW3984829.1 LysM peptidoglycan-binding domain-containing protein [Neisseria meningitidis]CWM85687.1 putative peptidoglycan-binding periplasmic protein [Neisseria meningitidis]CWN84553.1 putative peptidoglycan-binding periplasmic protein [Neisseria meningitidis]CWQ91358.1 putative peptidoglycan-binding periplasmic protein [Neisseria meningitidis]CWR95434.1 putative peptidoglycan-binding periplasmic protein [Neisser